MHRIKRLFENNRHWAEEVEKAHPGFFTNLASQQSPQFLWIGCADSRVPANEIVGLLPGEIFVHRNVANVVVHSDLNCLSVIQYAVEVLRVAHVIVCGHYGCGGVRAATEEVEHGLIDNWLRHISDVQHKHQVALDAIADPEKRIDRLCELNVIEQVYNVCQTTILQNAWRREQPLAVHGWVYDLHDGLICDLKMTVSGLGEINPVYRSAVAALDGPASHIGQNR
jgi:carbonic anhydrase